MKLSSLHTFVLALGAAIVAGTAVSDSASAQQPSNSMFDADTYWSGYWDWYDTEYVPGYRLRARSPLAGGLPPNRAYVPPGASPAISGAPDAGGDYDDYAAEFYVPGGASEFYDKPGARPAGDVVTPNVVAPLEETPAADPDVVVTDPDVVVTDPDAPRTIRPRARSAEERSRIPPDIDAETPEPERPVAESKPEIWY